ncbi:MAG: GreA/GreB family elongation factor, partial [Nitrospira sp.]|nr:GreA/GreB family elongation factor [Nitrospira sp.]
QSLDDQPILTKVVTIVPSQSDPDSGIINQHSAIGRALMGSQLNDEVEVELPDGSRTIQIIKIEKNKNDQMDAK